MLAFTDRSLRVLVADDYPDAAETLHILLELWGHDVRTVFDGLEALKVGREFRPEVAFLDIQMPGMNGIEVARRLRESQKEPRPWIIGTSAFSQQDRLLQGQLAAFDAYFVKPYNLSELEKLLAGYAETRGRTGQALQRGGENHVDPGTDS